MPLWYTIPGENAVNGKGISICINGGMFTEYGRIITECGQSKKRPAKTLM